MKLGIHRYKGELSNMNEKDEMKREFEKIIQSCKMVTKSIREAIKALRELHLKNGLKDQNGNNFGWDEEDIEKYLKKHPMPEDKSYSKSDMINDLVGRNKTDSFPEDLNSETEDFMCELLKWLYAKVQRQIKKAKETEEK